MNIGIENIHSLVDCIESIFNTFEKEYLMNTLGLYCEYLNILMGNSQNKSK